MSVTRDAVLACLKTLNDPVSGKDIVELGLVKALTVDDGAVGPRNILNDNACHGLLLRMDRVIGATTKGSTRKKRMRICWRHH